MCNLASIALPRFVVEENPASPTGRTEAKKLRGSLQAGSRRFDHAKLAEITRKVTRNLNRIIDVNYYPVETARRSNMRHRPIGLGVQGLADVFILLGLPFDSPEAQKLNAEIFETIYFAALTESNAIAAVDGTYESYPGSPVSKGVLQPDMWGVTEMPGGDRHDWKGSARPSRSTARNSLLVAPMPTASTSQILGNNECFEPYTSNIYARRVLSGEFTVVNNHLLADLTELGLWDPSLKNDLIANNGSVQGLDIPDNLKAIYKTVWEIKQRVLVDMAADRGAFIDQSQSFNVHMSDANSGKLTSLHFYAWKKGLKTGMYYLVPRRRRRGQVHRGPGQGGAGEGEGGGEGRRRGQGERGGERRGEEKVRRPGHGGGGVHGGEARVLPRQQGRLRHVRRVRSRRPRTCVRRTQTRTRSVSAAARRTNPTARFAPRDESGCETKPHAGSRKSPSPARRPSPLDEEGGRLMF